jgi:hypothetical protein
VERGIHALLLSVGSGTSVLPSKELRPKPIQIIKDFPPQPQGIGGLLLLFILVFGLFVRKRLKYLVVFTYVLLGIKPKVRVC